MQRQCVCTVQTRLSQLGSSAKDFVSHTGASLRTAAGTLGQGAKPGAGPAAAAAALSEAAATGRARAHGGNGAAAAGDADPATGLGLGADHELEAALRDAMRSGSPGGFRVVVTAAAAARTMRLRTTLTATSGQLMSADLCTSAMVNLRFFTSPQSYMI